MSVKISKLNVEIGKKEISLTLEEAKELQKILNDTFGEQKTVVIPSSPVIIKRPVIRRPWLEWNDYIEILYNVQGNGLGNI
jgi:hypothetical protein